MAAFVIFDTSTGEIQSAITVSNAPSAPDVMTANTPTGMSALSVDLTHAVLNDQSSWQVVSGALAAVVPTDAALLAAAQKLQENILSDASLTAQYAPVSYMGTTFACSEQQIGLVQFCLTQADTPAGLPSGFTFCDNNLAEVAMTLAELQGLYNAMFTPLYEAYIKLCGYVVAVYAATTVADVQAIVWS